MTTFNVNTRVSYMMRKLAADLTTTTERILYEVPSGMSARIVSIWIASNHNNNVNIRIFHTRAGESAANSNALFYDTSIPANTTTVYDSPVLMVAGDRIWIRSATASTICVTLYGEEM